MNYFEHHIGDYLRDTAHLSLLEHGVYRRLLDVYYTREEPLPADCGRLIGARSRDEKSALKAVLEEFFEPAGEGWSHRRCEAEIARFKGKREKAKASAEARWSKSDRNANASSEHDAPDMRTHMRPHDERNATRAEAPARPQSPDTRHQAPEEGVITPSARAALVPRFKAVGILPEIGLSDYVALVAAGVTWDEFEPHVERALQADKPFRYLVATVIGQRKRAADRGPIPPAPASTAESYRERDERLAREKADAFMGRRPANQPAHTGEVIDMEASDVAPRRLG